MGIPLTLAGAVNGVYPSELTGSIMPCDRVDGTVNHNLGTYYEIVHNLLVTALEVNSVPTLYVFNFVRR